MRRRDIAAGGAVTVIKMMREVERIVCLNDHITVYRVLLQTNNICNGSPYTFC